MCEAVIASRATHCLDDVTESVMTEGIASLAASLRNALRAGARLRIEQFAEAALAAASSRNAKGDGPCGRGAAPQRRGSAQIWRVACSSTATASARPPFHADSAR